MIRTRFALAVGAVALLASAPLAAQTSCNTSGCVVTVNAHATVNDVLLMDVGTSSTDLGTPLAADYTAGFKDAGGPTVHVTSNRPYDVTVSTTASQFTYSGSLTDPAKPVSDLQWGTAAGTYTNDASASATLMSGNPTADDLQQIFFRTNWDIASDVPGDYTVALDFTLTTP